MIRIQLMSDLHIQHHRNRGVNYWQQEFVDETQTDADVLVLAGDVVDLRPRDMLWSIARLTEFGARYPNVLYVPGNHEYYGTSIEEGNDLLDSMEAKLFGVTVLKPGRVVEINGHRFLGGVMWQPRGNLPLPNPRAEKINDHYTIQKFERQHWQEYERFHRFIEAKLKPGDIVVTHHAPHMQSIDAQWAGNSCNRWFVTPEMQPLIYERKPALWMHGHMHTPFDYMAGDTRIVCNPFGYPNEGVKFNPKLVIDL